MSSGVSITSKTGNLHFTFNSNTSLPLNQHPEDKGLCSYDVFFRTLGGMIETKSTTPQYNRVSERDGHMLATTNRCMLRGGLNTSAGVTVTETKRQRAQIQDSTPEEAIVAETEHQRKASPNRRDSVNDSPIPVILENPTPRVPGG